MTERVRSSILGNFFKFLLFGTFNVGGWVLGSDLDTGRHRAVRYHDVVGSLLEDARSTKAVVGLLVRVGNVVLEFIAC